MIATEMLPEDCIQAQEALLMVPAARMGSAEEIAAGVLFLASEEASYCVGVSLGVDGGLTEIQCCHRMEK